MSEYFYSSPRSKRNVLQSFNGFYFPKGKEDYLESLTTFYKSGQRNKRHIPSKGIINKESLYSGATCPV